MNRMPHTLQSDFSTIWRLSLFSFVLAGLTGFLYRLGFLIPLPEWLNLINIRHAHSHLMFFNWISPPIMIWMASAVVTGKDDGGIPAFRWCIYSMMTLGFLSWPFFLLYGYRPVAVGNTGLPVAAMLSGLVMITWYWFCWLYYSYRKDREETRSLLLFDAALVALVVSSLGAWGVSVYQFSSIDSPLLSKALTSFFLGVFTEGWVILGILGILWWDAGEQNRVVNDKWLWLPLLVGSMLIFPYSLDLSMITPAMMWSAKAGLLLMIISLSMHLVQFLEFLPPGGVIRRVILPLLGLKILFQMAAFLPVGVWPGEHGLRILYLHLILLGFGSIGVIAACTQGGGVAALRLFAGAAGAVILTLVMLSGYWPQSLMPSHLTVWVTAAALLPVLPAGWLLVQKPGSGSG